MKECPHCGSKHIWKAGIRNTVNKGKRQRYMCAVCAKTFYDGQGIVMVDEMYKFHQNLMELAREQLKPLRKQVSKEKKE